MSREKIEFERYEISEIIASSFDHNGEKWDASDFEWSAHCLQMAGFHKQEWISVEERLPEKDVRVLVCIKSDRSYTNIDTDRLDNRGFVRWYKDVTHWMPLPEAPKMKGGKE